MNSAIRLFRDPVMFGSNSLNTNNTLTLKYTADNDAGTAATTDQYVFSGVGDSARQALGTGISLSGDYSTIANLIDFVKNVPMNIVAIQMQTDDTDNFAGRLYYGNMNPNRQNEITPNFDLTKFRQPTGNGYADSLTIPVAQIVGGGLVTIPQFFMKTNIKKNTYIQFTFYIDTVCQEAPLKPASF